MSTLSANIGYHLFVGIEGTDLSAATRRFLSTIRPAGIVLFARNVGSAADLLALCRALRFELPFRPLVAIDEEGGHVNRLRKVVGELPTIAKLKEHGATENAEEFGRNTGRWLHQFDIDIDFAPVFDLELFDEKTDNALRERCWGNTADEVIRWAGAFMDGLEREGVTACPKHFPGLGGAQHDSHEHLPTIRRTRQQLFDEDLRPYTHFMRRLSAIMVSHGHYPALDGDKPIPASLSPRILTDLLRAQLRFTGLALTDDMEMGAIARFGSFEDAIVEAFRAGADMMLVCHTAEKIVAAHEALAKAAESRKIPPQRLAESAARLEKFHSEWIAHRG